MAISKHSALTIRASPLIHKLKKIISRRNNDENNGKEALGHQIIEMSKQVALQQGRSNYLEKEVVEVHKLLNMEKSRANDLERKIVETLKQANFEKIKADFVQKQLEDIKEELNSSILVSITNGNGPDVTELQDQVRRCDIEIGSEKAVVINHHNRINRNKGNNPTVDLIDTESNDSLGVTPLQQMDVDDLEASVDCRASQVLCKDQFTCGLCNAIFSRKLHLTKHKKVAHKRCNIHKCDECEYSTSNKKDLKRHCKGHKIAQIFKCEQCSYSTERKSYFIRHIDIMHKNMATQNMGPGKCVELPIEGHIAKSLSGIKDTLAKDKMEIAELITPVKKTAKRREVHQCEECTESFSSKRGLKQHKKGLHCKNKVYECGRCETTAPSKVELKRHVKEVHNNKMDFKCTKCNYITERKSYFVRHVEIMHRDIISL